MKRMFFSGLSLLALSLNGCGSDSADVGAQLSSAVTYLSSAIPNFGNTVGGRAATDGHADRTIEFITPARFVSATVADQIDPPGGTVSNPADEPTYLGSTIPTKVNYRDYLKMSLDENFKRTSNGRTFRPTLYGRFDNIATILTTIASSGVAMDGGMPAVGAFNVSVTVENQAVRVIGTVSAASNTTYYDRKLDLYGFSDTDSSGTLNGSETKMFHNLMWMRVSEGTVNTASTMNFMFVELGDRNSDATSDTVSISVLNWNRTTGKMMFEYVSVTDDAISNANMEVYRALIESTNGKTWVYGFSGKAASSRIVARDFMQWAIFTPTSASTLGTASMHQIRNDGNTWQGNICATFATGVGEVGDTTGDAEPASGGTCAGQVTDSLNIKSGIMGAIFGIRADTTWQETANDKGFPASTYNSFASDEGRAAWLTAGESISASFSDRTGFIAQWDATP